MPEIGNTKKSLLYSSFILIAAVDLYDPTFSNIRNNKPWEFKWRFIDMQIRSLSKQY